MILSYWACRYGNLDTLNSKIHPLFQILDTDPGWCNNSRGMEEEENEEDEDEEEEEDDDEEEEDDGCG